jgi:signal peptidase I
MKRLSAAFLSLLFPGLGHFKLGRVARGSVLLALYIVAALSSIVIGVIGLGIATAIWIYGAVDVFLLRRVAPRTFDQVLVPLAIAGGISIALFVVVRIFVLEGFRIPSGGDLPTLWPGDHIMTGKWDKVPARGEMIVFEYPRDRKKDFIKRVVGVAGDRISVRAGELRVNGAPAAVGAAEPCQFEDLDDHAGTWRVITARCVPERLGNVTYTVADTDEWSTANNYPSDSDSFTVPDGTVFVMGDNRENSYDSRFWGPVPLDHVKGKALFIWWSSGPHRVRFDRIGQKLR